MNTVNTGETGPGATGAPGDAWARLLGAHYEWLRVHHYSPRTVVTRTVHLGALAEWCRARGCTDPAEVGKSVLEAYQRHLYYYRKKNGQPLALRTQRGALAPVQAFFKWLVRQNFLPANPASELELPRGEKRLPPTLSAEEAERVLALASPDVGDPAAHGAAAWACALRDRAILETLYSTGLRRMELANLRLYDVEPERGRVFVRQGKGRKDRVVPIGERAAGWVRRYLEEARPTLQSGPDEGWLFLTQAGAGFTPERLTELVRDYVRRAGLGHAGGACHLFRHTCATLMLEGGADVRFIQQLLGHAQLTTTQLYTQVSIVQLQRVHALAHPAETPRQTRANAEPGRDDDPAAGTR